MGIPHKKGVITRVGRFPPISSRMRSFGLAFTCAVLRLRPESTVSISHGFTTESPKSPKCPGGSPSVSYTLYTPYILLLFVLDTYTVKQGVPELLVFLGTQSELDDCFVPHSGYFSFHSPCEVPEIA